MSSEDIIKQIKQDSKKEIQEIQKETQKQVKRIIQQAKKEAENEAEKIKNNGKNNSEKQKKIMISKANQDSKKEIMIAKEEIIDECFTKSIHKLSTIPENEYRKIVKNILIDAKEKIGKNCKVITSRSYDKEIARELNLEVVGTVDSNGGVIVKSEDGRTIIDQTFKSILKREKENIRNKVGKLLFS